MLFSGQIGLVTVDEKLQGEVINALAETGYQVVCLASAQAAAESIERDETRLVLIDMNIGVEKTIDACDVLKKSAGRPIGILVIVSSADDDVVARLLDASADDVLSGRLRHYGMIARINSQMRRIETAEKLALKVRDSWTLIDITSRLVGSGDLLENLYDMVDILSRELEVDRVSVVLVRPEGDYGLVIASSDNPDVQDLVINLGGYPEIQRVLRDRQPLIVDDVSDSEVLEEVLSALRRSRVSSVALFPIIEDDKVLGVIFLRFMHNRDTFAQRELVFCQTVANATAIALRNHEILESLREKDQQIEQVQSEARSRLAALKPYEDFFLRSVDGLVVLSDSGVVLFVNPEGAATLGKRPEEIRGVPFSRFLPDSQTDRLGILIDESERGRRASVDFTITSDMELDRIISTSAAPLGNEGMILLTMRDVTDERLMAKRLVEAQERLIENEKQTAMMEVAGAAAHEMNQPLTSVLTSIAMLKRLFREDPRAPMRLIETMEQEVERMAAIIRRLSKLTEYTTKEYVGEAKIIDLEKASGDQGSKQGE